jgi:hypothetical protein
MQVSHESNEAAALVEKLRQNRELRALVSESASLVRLLDSV